MYYNISVCDVSKPLMCLLHAKQASAGRVFYVTPGLQTNNEQIKRSCL